MFSASRNTWAWFLFWLFVPSLLMAVEPAKTRKAKAGKPANSTPVAPAENVELFKAIDAQQLAVQFVPNNAEVAHIIVTNITKKPLGVQLPTVFAARPVLAQFQVPGGGGQQGHGGVGTATRRTSGQAQRHDAGHGRQTPAGKGQRS